MKCFYNNKNLDGKCSAAIIKNEFTDCEMIGINYENEFPWDDIEVDETIYMVDFCFQQFQQMIYLNSVCELVWIDHYKFAMEEHSKLSLTIEGLRKIEAGTCALVWEFLYPKRAIPCTIQLLADYSIGDYTNPECRPFQYGMRIEDTSPDSVIWHKVLSHGNPTFMNRKIAEGEAIRKYMIKSQTSLIQPF